MGLNYGYFDSINGDRLYDADTMSQYFTGIVGRGIVQTYGDGLQVVAVSDMTVAVGTGKAFFTNGKWVNNTSDYPVVISDASEILPRIDRIVLRCDNSTEARNVTVVLKTGVASETPTVPELDSSDTVEELSLCQIYVGAGVTEITQSNITDERPDDELCGFLHQLFDNISTTDIFAQYDAAFNEWFSNTKETLATMTLLQQFTSSYTTTVQDQAEIPINISQFNMDIDILNVYINGLKLIQGVDYTKYADHVALTEPVDTGTQIEFEVLKSVDGSAAESVVSQVSALQEETTEIKKYDYYCNGTNDNKLLTELCENYLNGKGIFNTHSKLTINVIGKFGIDTTVLYDGEESRTCSMAIMGTDTKEICLDFAKCDRINANGGLLYAQNATIRNLSAKHGNNNLDVDIYTLSGFNATFENCSIAGNYTGGECTAIYLNNSKAINCTVNVTNNGATYGIVGVNARMDNCDVAVASTGLSAYGTSGTNNRANNCNFSGTTESTATDASGNGGIGGGIFTNCLFTGFGGLKGHGFYLRASNAATITNCIFRGYTKSSASGTAVGFTTAVGDGNTMILHGINCNQVAVTGYTQLASMAITGGYGVYDGLFYTAPTIYNAENVVSHGSYNRNRA